MTSFIGWADAWGNSWGSGNPNDMSGSASFSISAVLTVNVGEMVGEASMSFTASLNLPLPIVIDTHDGFWDRQWEKLAKNNKATKKVEKKKKVIEAEDKPVEIIKLEELPAIEIIKPIKTKSNRLIVDKVIESNYDVEQDDEDLLMLW